MAGFLFLRARGHRLLLTAALLAVLLTTSVLATLAAFAGSVGDAGLRHALSTRDAAAASLIITAENPGPDRAAAARDARRGAQRSFDGLPLTLRQFDNSGPYSLPRALQPKAARGGEPDLTTFAAVDRSRVRLSAGSWPTAAPAQPATPAKSAKPATPASGTADGVVGVALHEAAARQLRLTPGPRVLSLADRLGGPPVKIRVTGLYRPADRDDPYWQLDELAGRGVRKDAFTTYGPLLTDPTALASGRISRGELAWLATADFTTFGGDRLDALRTSAKNSQRYLGDQPALTSRVVTRTALPEVLDQLERALLVSRATLLIVSLQLVLLAGYALLLVARLLGTERESETRVLLARGASRGRIASLSALEALLLAAPAAICAPLLAGPLTRLLAGQGLLERIGLRIDTALTVEIWLVGLAVAVACAAAVVAPALTATRAPRARALPAPLRAGADLGLLVVAGVAYWQLDRRTSGGGALSGTAGGEGRLGIDPLLVVAPALALLAGTVLALRLLPPAAKLAERRAARSRGLTAPLAGWQLSRRPLRGTGPVLLLVLAVAMGMLAIGQGASWDRSQDDQADFRAGAPVRVLGGGTIQQFGQGGTYDGMPGVRAAVPAARTGMGLSGGRQATVLAIDTALAGDGLRPRADLADGDSGRLIAALHPPKTPRAGVVMPPGTARLALDVTLSAPTDDPFGRTDTPVTVTVEDRHGVSYRISPESLRPVGGRQSLTVDLAKAADAPVGRPAEPLALTAIEFDQIGYPDRIVPKRFTVGGIRSIAADGTSRTLIPPPDLGWQGKATVNVDPVPGRETRPAVTAARSASGTALDLGYHLGTAAVGDSWGPERTVTVRAAARRPAPTVPAALATDRFLESTAAKVGSVIEVPMSGGPVKVRIAGALRAIPTTGAAPVGPTTTKATAVDGGALLVDLRAVNRILADRADAAFPPTEWWLYTRPGAAEGVVAALRERAEIDPAQIQVRDEIAAELHDDPLGAGPQSALLAVTGVAAALAAVGFAVATAGALRERSAEFAVLRALGTTRRRLARVLAVEQSLLIGVALLIGLALGAVLTRAVVPLIVLTGQATQPIPAVLVELPLGRVALLIAGVAAAPVAIVAALALRRGDPATSLRAQGGE
ncbi:FtsX-like permease family protein [Streptomyces sp. NPDC020965]|uniref:FtsX-like permease family protein n=1 Tax=Streptomyces sp. NPDC020965 TaxID=3365105 RepID=UPI00378F994D